MEYIGLTVDLKIMKIEMTEDEQRDYDKGLLHPSDFDCYQLFTKDQWIKFKSEVNGFQEG